MYLMFSETYLFRKPMVYCFSQSYSFVENLTHKVLAINGGLLKETVRSIVQHESPDMTSEQVYKTGDDLVSMQKESYE